MCPWKFEYRKKKREKQGWPEAWKITSCLLAEGEEPRKSNGENGRRKLWCTGANQVQEWRPCENWPLEREGEKDSSWKKWWGVGAAGRGIVYAYGLGEGLLLQGSLSPGNQCRELVRKRVLLDELGLWSWTSQMFLLLHPRDWWLSTSVEITAHIPLGAAMQVGLRRAAAGWTSCAPSTSWEEQVLNFWMLAFLLASFLNDSWPLLLILGLRRGAWLPCISGCYCSSR